MKAGVLAAAAVLAASLVGCFDVSGPYLGRVRQPVPGHVRWCTLDPDSVDPARPMLVSSQMIAPQLFDGLVVLGADMQPRPSLAESWDISSDQRVYTFHLRTDARFSNGRPIKAEDVRYSMVRVLDPRTAAVYAQYLWPIRHARAFTAGAARQVTTESGPFHAGDAIELVKQEPPLPNPDLRVVTRSVALRAWPDENSEIFATLLVGSKVFLVECDASGERSYVFHDSGEGMYGWLPSSALSSPNADVLYPVASLDDPVSSRRVGTVRGGALRATPDLVGIRAPDPHTLVVETGQPTPGLLQFMAIYDVDLVVPREVISHWPRSWIQPSRIVTSGAYHLVAWRERDRLEMVQSATFWDRDNVGIDRLTISGSLSATSRYLFGSCDVLDSFSIPHAMAALFFDAAGQPRTREVHARGFLESTGIVLNTQRLSDRALRQALALAIDVRGIAILRPGYAATGQWTPGKPVAQLTAAERALCGVQPETPGVVSIVEPGALCYVPPPPLGFHPDQARAELAAARERNAVPEKIVFNVPSAAQSIKVAEWVAAQWQANLGLEVDIRTQDLRAYYVAPLANSDAGFLGLGDITPDPERACFLTTARCGDPSNYGSFCNDEFEGFLDAAASLVDRRQRLALVRQAEEVFMREVPVIPLGMARPMFALVKPYVKNVNWLVADWRIDENWRGEP
ncbi:MAG: hypothetical protein JXR83_14180 [Deltaproteobacteria bacterium]|nr:hypothetical protein [Deltaproteobacteria bacterium]